MPYSYAAFATFPDRDSAQAALVDLPDFGLGYAKVKLFECSSKLSQATILDGLMSNGTWAESDGRRGLTIGLVLGASWVRCAAASCGVRSTCRRSSGRSAGSSWAR